MVRNSVTDAFQRIALVIVVFALLGFALAATQSSEANSGTGNNTWISQSQAAQPSLWGMGAPAANYARAEFVAVAAGKRIALLSGHAGNDSGAVCMDSAGAATLVEADINAVITQRVAESLSGAGASVLVLEEYDPRINNLDADLLLSLHADSCIEATGFKAARYVWSHTATADDRLVECINSEYAAATGLAIHANTVTHNMTEYHAFRKVGVNTPAAILEMGFLGGDGALLQSRPDVPAQGVLNALYCYLSRSAAAESVIGNQ